MKNNTSEKIKNYINKIVEREVDKKIQSLKKEILSEIKRERIAKPIISEKTKQLSKPILNKKQRTIVKDPLLNEILLSTSPLESETNMYELNSISHNYNDDGYTSVLPNNTITEDSEGRAINKNKDEVKSVLDVMNRDYSKFLKKVDEISKKTRN
jgi:hypothetical protein